MESQDNVFAIDTDEKIGDEFNKLIMNNINKYYKLKKDYNDTVETMKKTLLKNMNLSRKERKKMFDKFSPKCIACGCQGGTMFRTYKNENSDRILEAYCKCPDKCDFKININVGLYKIINKSIVEMTDELNAVKKKIIIHKNDLLFGIQKEDNDVFKNLVSNLEDLNSEYGAYSDHYVQYNDNNVNNEKVILNETELIRVVNLFDDAMMSNPLLKSLQNFQNSDLFIEGSLTYINYYVCQYFLRNINIEINKMKEDENYYNLTSKSNALKFKKKEALVTTKELFERIVKYKYGKNNFKKDETTNVITFLNNFTNSMEFNEGNDPTINDFIIDVKNVNVKTNTKRKTRAKQKEQEEQQEPEIIPIDINDDANDDANDDDNIQININQDYTDDDDDDDYEDYDVDDDEDYKKEPITIGEDIKLDEVEELK